MKSTPRPKFYYKCFFFLFPERIFVSSAPDPMGPPMNNLKHLLRIPPGGGEQNLLNLLPAIVLADYMKKTGKFVIRFKF